MPTRLELIAEAFPLHCQRIVEETCVQGDERHMRWFRSEAESWTDAFTILSAAFVWSESAEGYKYWAALAYWDAARTRGN